MPEELAEQLTRDYHLARLRALYGGSQITYTITTYDPAAQASAVREELIRLGKRNQGLGGIFGGDS